MFEQHIRMAKLLLLLFMLICISAFVNGCFFGRIDWENDRKSATIITIGKAYVWDTNSISSDPEKASVFGAWGGAGIGDE